MCARNVAIILIAVASFLGWAMPARAQFGPVGTMCANDIQKFCANKGHGHRQTRSCLEAHYGKVSRACRHALDTTGGGWQSR